MQKQVLVTPLLDEVTAAFMQRRVSINVASANADREPALSRAYGCHVSDDRTQVTLFLYQQTAAQVLQCIAYTRSIAVVFSRPSTHETLQLKGSDATLIEVADSDRASVDLYRASFVEELLQIGYSREFAAAMMEPYADQLVGVRFRPDAAFIATPGPRAGQSPTP